MITAWIKDLESSKLDWKCLRNKIFFRERLPSRHWAWNKALKFFAIIPIIFLHNFSVICSLQGNFSWIIYTHPWVILLVNFLGIHELFKIILKYPQSGTFWDEMLHSISFEIIISICLYKISFIKTTYANIKIVILSNEMKNSIIGINIFIPLCNWNTMWCFYLVCSTLIIL